MSEFLHDEDELGSAPYDLGDVRYEDDDARARRRRGLWGLLVLALVSVTIVALFSFLLGTSGKHHPSVQAGPLPNDGPAVSVLPSSSTASTAHHGKRHHHPATAGATPSHRAKPSQSASASRSASAGASAGASASSSAAEVASVPTASTISTAPSARPTTRPHRTSGPCSSAQPCAVGGLAGADSAINAYRARQGQQPIQITSSSAATQCALSDGAQDCTSPFAVVPVATHNGAEAIREIVGSGGDWLADAAPAGVSVGWAYLPSARTYICAVVTN